MHIEEDGMCFRRPFSSQNLGEIDDGEMSEPSSSRPLSLQMGTFLMSRRCVLRTQALMTLP